MNREQKEAHLALHGFGPHQYPGAAAPDFGIAHPTAGGHFGSKRWGVGYYVSEYGMSLGIVTECSWGDLSDDCFELCWEELRAGLFRTELP